MASSIQAFEHFDFVGTEQLLKNRPADPHRRRKTPRLALPGMAFTRTPMSRNVVTTIASRLEHATKKRAFGRKVWTGRVSFGFRSVMWAR